MTSKPPCKHCNYEKEYNTPWQHGHDCGKDTPTTESAAGCCDACWLEKVPFGVSTPCLTPDCPCHTESAFVDPNGFKTADKNLKYGDMGPSAESAGKKERWKCGCDCCVTESAADGGWEKEFEEQSPLAFHGREWAKAFISDLLRKEREKKYTEETHRNWLEEGAKAERERLLAELDKRELKKTDRLKIKSIRALIKGTSVIQSPPTSQNEGV